MGEVRAKVMELTGSEHAANLVALEWKKGIDATAQAATDSAAAIRGVSDATEELNGLLADLDKDEAALRLDGQFRDLEQAATDAWNATAEGAGDAAEKQDTYQLELIDTKRKVADYGREVLGLPDEKITELLAMIDEGKLAEVDAELDRIARSRNVPMIPTVGAGGMGGSNDRPGGTGGPGAPAPAPTPPSKGGAKVEALSAGRSGATVNVYLTVLANGNSPQAYGAAVAEALTAWWNDGGSAGWMAA
jgi:hypothetical protein